LSVSSWLLPIDDFDPKDEINDDEILFFLAPILLNTFSSLESRNTVSSRKEGPPFNKGATELVEVDMISSSSPGKASIISPTSLSEG
jgi:hypothetical protein